MKWFFHLLYIKCIVLIRLLYKYEKELSEDRFFSIGKFSVASNVWSYRTARHPYKINFQYGTKIKQCDDKFVPASIYVIDDPREIFQSQYDTDYLIGKLAKKEIIN